MRKKTDLTLCVLKPDAMKRGIVNDIIKDIHEHGFKTTNFVVKKLSVVDVYALYFESKGQTHFIDLLEYMTSGKCVYFLVEAENAANRLNEFVGVTDPSQNGKDTLRGRYGINILKNTIHSSNEDRAWDEIKQLYEVDDIEDLDLLPDLLEVNND